jgi:hypothetical protein
MADVKVTGGKLLLKTANGSANYVLGDASPAGETGSAMMVSVFDTGSLSVSIVVKARARGRYADADAVTWLGIPYKKLYLNGAVADNSYVSTAITGNSLIVIPASGLSISLEVTFTSGTGTIYWTPITQGAAA